MQSLRLDGESVNSSVDPSQNRSSLPKETNRVQRKWLHRSILVVTVFTGGYFALAFWIGLDRWEAALKAASGWSILSAFGLIMLGFLIRAGRWIYYTALLEWEVPLLSKLTAFVASFGFTATPGKAGELMKAVLLRTRHNVSLTEAAGILLIERLGDLLAVAVLACGALTIFGDLGVYVFVSVVLVGGAGLVAAHPRFARSLLERLFTVRRIGPIARRLVGALDAGRTLLRPRPVVIGGAMALVAWSCEALAFRVVIESFGIHQPWLVAMSVYGLATLAGALSMLPGGLGGVEVVMVLLLTRLGAATLTATMAMIIFRLLTLWLFSLTGIAFMFGWLAVLSKSPATAEVLDAQ